MIELQVVDKNFNNTRKDTWWVEPVVFGVTFILFATYSLAVVIFDFDSGVAARSANLAGTNYNSPFYGPNPDKIFGSGWWPAVLPFAFFTLWAPFGFRGTCYYMRRVYYRSIFPLITSQGPPACAVDGLNTFKGKYKGETSFPWFLNNFHRYFLYAAIALGIFHWYEAFHAMWFDGSLGLGVGTILAFVDAIFLTLYITSCHAFRHLLGGGVDKQGTTTNKIWSFISGLNINHGRWFWYSLTSIWVWDIYLRLVSHGIITDLRLF